MHFVIGFSVMNSKYFGKNSDEALFISPNTLKSLLLLQMPLVNHQKSEKGDELNISFLKTRFVVKDSAMPFGEIKKTL